MPFFRRRFKPRFVRRTRLSRRIPSRRTFTRRPTFKRFAKGLRQPVQYFKRTTQYSVLGVSGSTGTAPIQYLFQLDDLPGSTEFSNLYDQYKISAIKIKFVPTRSVNAVEFPVSVGRQAVMPFLHTCIDYDQDSGPGSLQGFFQYQNHKMTRGSKTHSRYFKPRFQDSLTSSNIRPTRGWISTANTDVLHFSLYAMIEAPGPSDPNFEYIVQSYNVYATYYLAMKCVK